MSVTPIINYNSTPVEENKQIIITTNGNFPAGPKGNTGPTGPTGPTGTSISMGEVRTNITAYDKIVSITTGEQIEIDNTQKYRQCLIQVLQTQIFPEQDFHGYTKPWMAGKGKNLYDKDSYPLTPSQYINRLDGTVGYLQNFAAVDLSSFYLDIVKDRLYTSGKKSLSECIYDQNAQSIF